MFYATGGTITNPNINQTYYYFDYSLTTPTEIEYNIFSSD